MFDFDFAVMSDVEFAAEFRKLAVVWNNFAGDAATLGPTVDACELEATKRGLDMSVILKGC